MTDWTIHGMGIHIDMRHYGLVLPLAVRSMLSRAAGYDCGVYLVCFVEQVVQQVLLKDTRTLEKTVSTTVVKQWRQKTLNSIQHQQKQK